jgi:hypothetical protein
MAGIIVGLDMIEALASVPSELDADFLRRLAVFGEGRQNEAYVPLPDGRAKGASGGGQPMQVENRFHVHISGARGTQEIQDAVRAGTVRAIASSAAMLKSYDQGLTGRMVQNDMRGI